MKISKAFAEYRKYEVVAMGYSSRTYQTYINAEKAVIGQLGNIEIEDITVDMVHEFYLGSLVLRSKNTTRSYISKLRCVIRFCSIRGVKTINPEEIKMPRCEKKIARFITVEEFNSFISEIARPRHGYKRIDLVRNVLITEMLFSTGLRIGELCALDRDSIKDRQFEIVGKSKEPRPGYITEEMEKMIEEYLSMRDDNNRALFINDVDKTRLSPSSVQRIFRRASKNSGIYSVTPHTLRHSYATILVEDGVDIRHVAELLGHQNLATTQKYTHIRNHKLRCIYEQTMGPIVSQKMAGIMA